MWTCVPRRSMDGIQTGIWSKQIVLHLEAQLKDLLSNAFAHFLNQTQFISATSGVSLQYISGMFDSSQM